MPRAANGNCTLAEPPFIANTTIVSADVNSDLDDIADMLTDSLSRSGDGAMLAQLALTDDGWAYSNDLDTGMIRSGTNEQTILCGNVAAAVIRGTVFAIPSGLTAVDISCTNLSISSTLMLAAGSIDNTALENSGVTAGSYTRPSITVSAQGIVTAASSGASPTRQVLTSGSGTYTRPAGVARLQIRMIGGGGGGGGSGSGAGPGGNGGAGGDTTFSTVTADGGSGGAGGNGATGGAGGAGGASGAGSAQFRIGGGTGTRGMNVGTVENGNIGGIGGCGVFGGAGPGGWQTNGTAAPANSGGGGGGAGTNANSVSTGGGGGAGEYLEFAISSPAGTYAYSVGAAGTGGSTGTSGFGGAAGGSGIIIVDEFYD